MAPLDFTIPPFSACVDNLDLSKLIKFSVFQCHHCNTYFRGDEYHFLETFTTACPFCAHIHCSDCNRYDYFLIRVCWERNNFLDYCEKLGGEPVNELDHYGFHWLIEVKAIVHDPRVLDLDEHEEMWRKHNGAVKAKVTKVNPCVDVLPLNEGADKEEHSDEFKYVHAKEAELADMGWH